MSIYTSIFIAAFGITVVYYCFGFKKGTGIVAFVFALAGANVGLEYLWPEHGQVIFLASLLPLAAFLYATLSRPARGKRPAPKP